MSGKKKQTSDSAVVDNDAVDSNDQAQAVAPAAVTFMLGRIDSLEHDEEESEEWKAGWAAACQQLRNAIGWEA